MSIQPEKLSDAALEVALSLAFDANEAFNKQKELAAQIASLRPAVDVEVILNRYKDEEDRRYQALFQHHNALVELGNIQSRFRDLSTAAGRLLSPNLAVVHNDPRLDGTGYLKQD